MLTGEQVESLNEILNVSFEDIKSLDDDREVYLEILNNLYKGEKIRERYNQNASVKQLTGFLVDATAETAKQWLAWGTLTDPLTVAQIEKIKSHVKTRISLEIQLIQPEVERDRKFKKQQEELRRKTAEAEALQKKLDALEEAGRDAVSKVVPAAAEEVGRDAASKVMPAAAPHAVEMKGKKHKSLDESEFVDYLDREAKAIAVINEPHNVARFSGDQLFRLANKFDTVCERLADKRDLLLKITGPNLSKLAEKSSAILCLLVDDALSVRPDLNVGIVDLQGLVFSYGKTAREFEQSDYFLPYCVELLTVHAQNPHGSGIDLKELLSSRASWYGERNKFGDAVSMFFENTKIQDIVNLPGDELCALLKTARKWPPNELTKTLLIEYSSKLDSKTILEIARSNDEMLSLIAGDPHCLERMNNNDKLKLISICKEKDLLDGIKIMSSIDPDSLDNVQGLAYIHLLPSEDAKDILLRGRSPVNRLTYSDKLELALQLKCLEEYLKHSSDKYDANSIATFATEFSAKLNDSQKDALVLALKTCPGPNAAIDVLVRKDSYFARALLRDSNPEQMLQDPDKTIASLHSSASSPVKSLIESRGDLRRHLDGQRDKDEAAKLTQLKADLDSISQNSRRRHMREQLFKSDSSSSAPSPQGDYDYYFKLLLIGDSGVGKSCLLLRYVDDTYIDSYISTIGVDFKIKTLQIANQAVKTQVWDTSGQERFRTLSSGNLRGAHGAVVAFDTTDKVTFKNVGKWVEELRNYSVRDINIILVGTKADLSERCVIDREEAQSLADSLGIPYIETSSKTDTNVKEAFQHLAKDILVRVMSADPKYKEALLSSSKPKEAEEINFLKARKMIETIQKMYDVKTINGAFLLVQPLFGNSKDKRWLDIAEQVRKIAYDCMVAQYKSLAEFKQTRRNFLMSAKTLPIFQQRTSIDGFSLFSRGKTAPINAIEGTLKDLEETNWPEYDISEPDAFHRKEGGQRALENLKNRR